jgi:hypothetical protein
MRTVLAMGAVAALACAFQAAVSAAAEPRHYVYVNRDRERIHDRAFLDTPALAGAQVKYTWRELEPTRDHYHLHDVLEDLAFLARHGKRLVLQLQDASFDERINTPDYLAKDPDLNGGIARKVEALGADTSKLRFDGWVARRWDPAVGARFARLLRVLGDSLDGRIEALVLSETAIDFAGPARNRPAGFTPESYLAGIRAQLAAARVAFTRSRIIQYANFMPGEWLPADDHGYLRGVYACAESLGLGVGGPDLRPFRKQLRNHSYPLIAARPKGVVAGVAVQDGNLADRDPVTGKRVSVAKLAAFARDSLQLDYVFWGTQEPYYSRDVLPWLYGQTINDAR